MKIQLLVLVIVVAAFACGEPTSNSSAKVVPKPTAMAVSSTSPKSNDGDYAGKGVVTKINMELGSVEMDHEDIPNLMPAMRMEFYVSDKKVLDGLKVGDTVDFVLRYKDRTETIVKLSKAK